MSQITSFLGLKSESKLHPVLRWIDLDELDFRLGAEVMILSLQEGVDGNAANDFRAITDQDHLQIVNSGFDQYTPAGIGRFVLKKLLTDFPSKIKPVAME